VRSPLPARREPSEPVPADTESPAWDPGRHTALYELLDTRLGQAKYLGGDEYSIADIATYPWTRQHAAQGAKIDALPNFKRWFEEISARPAVKKANDFVTTIKSKRETATDDQKDRFFNRGRYARA